MTEEQIIQWVRRYLANLINIPEAKIENTLPLNRYGLDSMSTVGILADLSEKIGIDLDEDLILAYPTIETLAGKVNQLINTGEEVTPPK
jgi:acyl carrier protein